MRTLSGNYVKQRGLSVTRPIRWYVLSNRTGAVIYRDYKKNQFEFVNRLENPDGALTEGELDSDRPGTGFSSGGLGTIHHGLDRTFAHHEAQAKSFSRKISQFLAEAQRDEKFTDLVLVAEPHFLGLLRGSLPASVKKMVAHEVNHAYIQGSDQKLKKLVHRALEAG